MSFLSDVKERIKGLPEEEQKALMAEAEEIDRMEDEIEDEEE